MIKDQFVKYQLCLTIHICIYVDYADMRLVKCVEMSGAAARVEMRVASMPLNRGSNAPDASGKRAGSAAQVRGTAVPRIGGSRICCRATTLFREGVSGTGIICLATTTPVHVLYLTAKFLLHTAQFNEQFRTVMIYSCLWKSLWFTLWSLSWSWFSLPVSESSILISDVSPHCYQSCICLLHVLNT